MNQEIEYPPVQPGGSLIIAWRIQNKKVLVVGGGNVAASRILNILNADGKVTVVSPSKGLVPEVKYRIDQGQVEYIDREFEVQDLDSVDICMAAIDCPETSSKIHKLCKERKIPVNIADVPWECDFYFGSQYRDGPLQIMVSTNGNGPRLASILRKRIAAGLPENAGVAVTKVGRLRQKLRELAPTNDQASKRMKWISQICEEWSLDDFALMSEQDMDELLKHYEKDLVPTAHEIINTGRQIVSIDPAL